MVMKVAVVVVMIVVMMVAMMMRVKKVLRWLKVYDWAVVGWVRFELIKMVLVARLGITRIALLGWP